MLSDMEKKNISAIVAIARDGAIGHGGGLLCHLPADLKHFRLITIGHSIVMGRRTADSLPLGGLPGRQNIVITRSRTYRREGFTVAHSLTEAIDAATMPGEVFVIGGAQIYAEALPLVDTLYVTWISAIFSDADTFFPDINPDEWIQLSRDDHDADEKNPYPYSFVTLQRRR